MGVNVQNSYVMLTVQLAMLFSLSSIISDLHLLPLC